VGVVRWENREGLMEGVGSRLAIFLFQKDELKHKHTRRMSITTFSHLLPSNFQTNPIFRI
jgi:hypothetical protein